MSTSRIRIKICGMTQREDILQAITLGVDAFGLIFYSRSPRCVTLEKAKQILQGLPAFVDAVAVFVNPEASFVQQVVNELPIQWLQFHGAESPTFCEQFGRPYIKAIPASSASVIKQAVEQYPNASAILLDTPSVDSYGGSGVPFDWNIIPQTLAKPIILAGGLNADTVAAAIQCYRPYAVDVSSGVELAPGIKNHDKMNDFVEAVHRLERVK